MTSISQVRQQLVAAVATVDVNQNGSVAHQEIKAAPLPQEVKKVLAQATSRAANSEGGQGVENVQRWVDTFAQDFQQFDADGSGSLSAEEISKAEPFRQQSQLEAMQRLVESDWLKSASGAVQPGKGYWDLLDEVKVDSEQRLDSPAGVDATLAQQLITACHQSSYTDVKSLEEAFAAVDGGEFVVRNFTDPANGKQYVGIDYGAGDNTFGAIFEAGSTRLALSIQDGDLEAR